MANNGEQITGSNKNAGTTWETVVPGANGATGEGTATSSKEGEASKGKEVLLTREKMAADIEGAKKLAGSLKNDIVDKAMKKAGLGIELFSPVDELTDKEVEQLYRDWMKFVRAVHDYLDEYKKSKDESNNVAQQGPKQAKVSTGSASANKPAAKGPEKTTGHEKKKKGIYNWKAGKVALTVLALTGFFATFAQNVSAESADVNGFGVTDTGSDKEKEEKSEQEYTSIEESYRGTFLNEDGTNLNSEKEQLYNVSISLDTYCKKHAGDKELEGKTPEAAKDIMTRNYMMRNMESPEIAALSVYNSQDHFESLTKFREEAGGHLTIQQLEKVLSNEENRKAFLDEFKGMLNSENSFIVEEVIGENGEMVSNAYMLPTRAIDGKTVLGSDSIEAVISEKQGPVKVVKLFFEIDGTFYEITSNSVDCFNANNIIGLRVLTPEELEEEIKEKVPPVVPEKGLEEKNEAALNENSHEVGKDKTDHAHIGEETKQENQNFTPDPVTGHHNSFDEHGNPAPSQEVNINGHEQQGPMSGVEITHDTRKEATGVDIKGVDHSGDVSGETVDMHTGADYEAAEEANDLRAMDELLSEDIQAIMNEAAKNGTTEQTNADLYGGGMY